MHYTVTYNTFQIVIGGWGDTMKCVIRKTLQGQIEVEKEVPGVLSCTEFKPFWVTWYEGLIQVRMSV